MLPGPQAVVSRKTPLDGKLEVSAATAARLSALGDRLAVVTDAGSDLARIEAMPCTCAKGSGERHVHHFVVSEIFKALMVGAKVRLELDEATATLSVRARE